MQTLRKQFGQISGRAGEAVGFHPQLLQHRNEDTGQRLIVVVESAVRGVKNVLRELRMLDDAPEAPDYQVIVDKSKWIRAEHGGFLEFHVHPGEVVEEGQPLSTNTNLLGRDRRTVYAPYDGVVIGMTTVPAISPGEPICNLGMLPKNIKPSELRKLRICEDGLEGRMVEELSTSLLVVDHGESAEPPTSD